MKVKTTEAFRLRRIEGPDKGFGQARTASVHPVLYHNVTTDMARTAKGLKSRTRLERTAPESLTRGLYGFVHGDIWGAVEFLLPARVARFRAMAFFGVQRLTAGALTAAAHVDTAAARAASRRPPILPFCLTT